ncbi:MAG TPA: HupE/UreJ family protein, partial [Burkholderiaceae bacterium]
VGTLRAAGLDVLKIVTAFTLAHSITLSLAALGFVSLPTRVVESAIAASVMLAAANNIWPLFQGRRAWAAFGFGLLHGFGFASVLRDLGLPQGALALSLAGFNVGVELGQLAIVAVFLPLAYAARTHSYYRKAVLRGGSALIMGLALVWLIERVFDLKLIS